MIDNFEIDAKAGELSVHRSKVQRDYAFGWLLSGFYRPHNSLQQLLIRKGGNCIRKPYFEHARYSNDLDFSTQSEADSNLLLAGIKRACADACSPGRFGFAGTRSPPSAFLSWGSGKPAIGSISGVEMDFISCPCQRINHPPQEGSL